MRTTIIVGSMLVAIAFAAPAPAAVIASATLIKDPSAGISFGGPDAALPAPWVSYLLSVTDTFYKIDAYDVLIEGPLHQRWIDGNHDGTFESTPGGTDQSTGDSHLAVPAGSIIGAPPTEDNAGTGSPLTSTSTALYGVGTSLQGAWATSESHTLDVAYIVIPKGSERRLNIVISLGYPDVGKSPQLTTRDFFPVPEPASIWLAAIAVAVMGVVLPVVRRGRSSNFNDA
jgi:hypothetical protein